MVEVIKRAFGIFMAPFVFAFAIIVALLEMAWIAVSVPVYLVQSLLGNYGKIKES